MSVKGQEFPAYDSRGIQGMGLAYATSNRGACHLRGYTVASEVLGIPVKTDPLATEGKPELVKAFQDATAVFDSAGICVFTSFAWTLADMQPQVGRLRGRLEPGQAERGGRAHLEHGAQFNNWPPASPPRTTTCRRASPRSRPRPARPRAWSTAWRRCCRSTTRCAGGRPRTDRGDAGAAGPVSSAHPV
jgi:hypothetical protein